MDKWRKESKGEEEAGKRGRKKVDKGMKRRGKGEEECNREEEKGEGKGKMTISVISSAQISTQAPSGPVVAAAAAAALKLCEPTLLEPRSQ